MPRILIIDDDLMIGQTLSHMMRRMGYEAVHAQTLKDGLKAAQTQPTDVILLDVQMPDGSVRVYLNTATPPHRRPCKWQDPQYNLLQSPGDYRYFIQARNN